MIKLPVKAVRREWEDAKGWINESWSLLDADGNELLGSEDNEHLEDIAAALNASAPTPERAMVAGDGWKRKTQDAVSALLTQAMKTLPFRDEAAAVDALLAEVTELPAPGNDDMPPGAKTIAEIFGPDYARRLAARLIRDAAVVETGNGPINAT